MRHNSGYLVHNGGDHHRTYSTDGEESHHAPSVRTVSEYAITHKPTTMVFQLYFSITIKRGKDVIVLILTIFRCSIFILLQMKPVAPSRKNGRTKYENVNDKKSNANRINGHGSDLSRDSPHHGKVRDTLPNYGSDIYVTGAPYRATSELRFLFLFFFIIYYH